LAVPKRTVFGTGACEKATTTTSTPNPFSPIQSPTPIREMRVERLENHNPQVLSGQDIY
jgi:hypothetical protein